MDGHDHNHNRMFSQFCRIENVGIVWESAEWHSMLNASTKVRITKASSHMNCNELRWIMAGPLWIGGSNGFIKLESRGIQRLGEQMRFANPFCENWKGDREMERWKKNSDMSNMSDVTSVKTWA